MKNLFIFSAGMALFLFFSCQNQPASNEEEAEFVSSVSEEAIVEETYLDSIIAQYGYSFLPPYFHMDYIDGKDEFIEEFDLEIISDFSYRVSKEPDFREKAIALISQHTGKLSWNEKRIAAEKAALYLLVSQIVAKRLSDSHYEEFSTRIDGVPEFQPILDQHLEREMGQVYESLASGEGGEVHVKMCKLLVEVDDFTRMEIIGRIVCE